MSRHDAPSTVRDRSFASFPRSWRLGILCLAVLCVSAIGVWRAAAPRERDWLIGRWQHSRTFDDGTIVERDWTVQSDGRLTMTNVYYHQGDRTGGDRQEAAGHWTVRGDQLTIRLDQPIQKDLIRMAARTRESVRHALTGHSTAVLDGETSQGRVTRDAPDRFTVQWDDPVAKKASEAQQWTRVR